MCWCPEMTFLAKWHLTVCMGGRRWVDGWNLDFSGSSRMVSPATGPHAWRSLGRGREARAGPLVPAHNLGPLQ